MALPGYLGQGFVSLYGIGTTTGVSGIEAPEGFLFSTIDGVWNSGNVAAQVGDNILYKTEDVHCRIVWDNATIVLLKEDKIVFTENVITPT